MKYIRTLEVVIFTLMATTLYCSQEQALIIKHAKAKHLSALKALTHTTYYDDFKPIILKGYADNPVVKAGMTDMILDEWITTSTNKFETILTEKTDQSSQVIIARHKDDKKTILGFCSFEKKTDNNESYVYINLLAVNKSIRKHGIGTALLFRAISAFNNVATCKLTTLAYANDTVHAFYERRGFVNCGITTIEPRTPDTHLLYQLVIEKKVTQ